MSLYVAVVFGWAFIGGQYLPGGFAVSPIMTEQGARLFEDKADCESHAAAQLEHINSLLDAKLVAECVELPMADKPKK